MHLKPSRIKVVLLLAGTAALMVTAAQSQQAGRDSSGFMEDYSILEPTRGEGPDLIYAPPGIEKQVAGYTKIMIDQPWIFLAPDSPHKGIKPDEAKALADGFREILTKSFAQHYEVVEEPGERVLYLRVGLTGLYLKRKVKFYNFTPVGAASLGLKTVLIDNVAKKFSLIEVAVEAEFYDSKTQKLLGAGVEYMGQAKDKDAGIQKDPTSWKELQAFLGHMSNRLDCRLSNSRLPEAERRDCYADEGEKKKG